MARAEEILRSRNRILLDPSRRGLINEDKTMVVGIDIMHPSPGSAPNAPSVAGMVASLDSAYDAS
jgi:hypothetical protein